MTPFYGFGNWADDVWYLPRQTKKVFQKNDEFNFDLLLF